MILSPPLILRFTIEGRAASLGIVRDLDTTCRRNVYGFPPFLSFSIYIYILLIPADLSSSCLLVGGEMGKRGKRAHRGVVTRGESDGLETLPRTNSCERWRRFARDDARELRVNHVVRVPHGIARPRINTGEYWYNM